MSFEDFVKHDRCQNPYESIDNQIRDAVSGGVAKRKSGSGYTYYVKSTGHGNSFTSVQPNIWIYVDPSIRQRINASLAPSAIRTTDNFEPVPENEHFKDSFGYRHQTSEFECCDLPDSVLDAITESYRQVQKSI